MFGQSCTSVALHGLLQCGGVHSVHATRVCASAPMRASRGGRCPSTASVPRRAAPLLRGPARARPRRRAARYVAAALKRELCWAGVPPAAATPRTLSDACALPISRCESGLRVAVCGAGPAGLAAAHALLSARPGGQKAAAAQVDVFERRTELAPALGGGIQLNGGAAILSRLGLLDDAGVAACLLPCERVLSRLATRDSITAVDVDVPAAMARWPAAQELALDGGGGEALAFCAMRAPLQRALAEVLPEGARLRLGEGVVAAREEVCGKTGAPRAMLMLDDGREIGPYDLVVGADGIGSAVRQAVAPQEARAEPSGIRVVLGVTPVGGDSARQPRERREMHQWFGDGAYGLLASYATGTPGELQDMVVLCVRNESALVARENIDYNAADSRAAAQALAAAAETAMMPAEFVATCRQSERVIETGVMFHDASAPWMSPGGAMVLVGDAAHAMPPFLGQGANQALQDAWCLAESLSQAGSVQAGVAAYETARRAAVEPVLQSSRFVGWLETQGGPVGTLVRDVALFAAGRLGVAEAIYVNGAAPRV